jgi:aspartate kinase
LEAIIQPLLSARILYGPVSPNQGFFAAIGRPVLYWVAMPSEHLIVQKYGGSSLGSPTRIREIAAKIAQRGSDGTKIIVTVSAMGQSTDDLMALAYQITPDPQQRELDMLLTVGERVSMALLSMALNGLGCPAI